MSQKAHTYTIEVHRKLIHISSLWIVLCIYALDSFSTVIFTVVLTVLLAYEWLRYKRLIPTVLNRLLQPMLRAKEMNGFRLTGASWMLLAACVCSLLFTPPIAFAAMLVLIISDSSAALIGTRWGSIAFYGKSLQGSLAFVISAWCCLALTGYIYRLDSPWYIAILFIAPVATTVELFTDRLRIDDNMAVPLSVALSANLIQQFTPLSWQVL